MRRHGIQRTRDGTYRVRLRSEERALLEALPGQLDDVLDDVLERGGGHGSDTDLLRLFPPAYEQPDDDAEYRRLVHAGLLESKRASLRALADTARADTLDEAQLTAWLGGLESLRLVLGTQLDVTEDGYGAFDPDEPDAARLALYHWLSWLQEEVVQALAAGLPRA